MSPYKERKNSARSDAITFPFASITWIRFKGYYLSPSKDTPKVAVKLKE